MKCVNYNCNSWYADEPCGKSLCGSEAKYTVSTRLDRGKKEHVYLTNHKFKPGDKALVYPYGVKTIVIAITPSKAEPTHKATQFAYAASTKVKKGYAYATKTKTKRGESNMKNELENAKTEIIDHQIGSAVIAAIIKAINSVPEIPERVTDTVNSKYGPALVGIVFGVVGPKVLSVLDSEEIDRICDATRKVGVMELSSSFTVLSDLIGNIGKSDS